MERLLLVNGCVWSMLKVDVDGGEVDGFRRWYVRLA